MSLAHCFCLPPTTVLEHSAYITSIFLSLTSHSSRSQLTEPKCLLVSKLLLCFFPPCFIFLLFIPSLGLLFHWLGSTPPSQFPHISTRGQWRRADTHCLPWPMDPASQWKMSFGEAINCIQFKDEGRNKFRFSEVWRKEGWWKKKPLDNFCSIFFMWTFLWNVLFMFVHLNS